MKRNILEVSKALFTNRGEWNFIDDENKSEFFFIFNRYFSKKYPNMSQLLNSKDIDKSLAMEIWFKFCENKPYPQWFWSKSKTTKSQNDHEREIIMNKWGLKLEEFNFLSKFHREKIEEELTLIKESQKNN